MGGSFEVVFVILVIQWWIEFIIWRIDIVGHSLHKERKSKNAWKRISHERDEQNRDSFSYKNRSLFLWLFHHLSFYSSSLTNSRSNHETAGQKDPEGHEPSNNKARGHRGSWFFFRVLYLFWQRDWCQEGYAPDAGGHWHRHLKAILIGIARILPSISFLDFYPYSSIQVLDTFSNSLKEIDETCNEIDKRLNSVWSDVSTVYEYIDETEENKYIELALSYL